MEYKGTRWVVPTPIPSLNTQGAQCTKGQPVFPKPGPSSNFRGGAYRRETGMPLPIKVYGGNVCAASSKGLLMGESHHPYVERV